MMTGMYAPTSGDALVHGQSITHSMPQAREYIGLCPQYDVILPMLTPTEMLMLVATFKGVQQDVIRETVDAMLENVGLTEKKDELSSTLSGGQKRKLSVAMAFIGDSKVVFLDEPTSGKSKHKISYYQMYNSFFAIIAI
jgi:ABC-type multidrug transport system ATPase subunit